MCVPWIRVTPAMMTTSMILVEAQTDIQMFARCCSVSIKSTADACEEQTLIEFILSSFDIHLHSTCCALKALGHDQHILPKCLKKGLSLSRLEGRSPQVYSSWIFLVRLFRLMSSCFVSLAIDHTYSLRVDSSCRICGHSVGFLYSKEAAWLTWQIAARRTLRKREPKGEDMTFLCRPVQHFKVLVCTL